MPNLKLEYIKCIEDEGWFFDDKVRITVNHKEIWKKKMGTDDEAKINKNYQFKRIADIRLYDKDSSDGEDRLGKHRVNRDDSGKGELKAVFKEDGAEYELYYEVIADPQKQRES